MKENGLPTTSDVTSLVTETSDAGAVSVNVERFGLTAGVATLARMTEKGVGQLCGRRYETPYGKAAVPRGLPRPAGAQPAGDPDRRHPYIYIKGELVLVATVGTDANRPKHPFGAVEGAAENAPTAQALLHNLVQAALDHAVCRLFIVAGAGALTKVIRRTSSTYTPIQRCQVHKARSITKCLPKPLHASVRRTLRQTWQLGDAKKAERLSRNLAPRLEHDAPGIRDSIPEALDESLTVNRLGLPIELRCSLACTNIVENTNGTVRRVCGNAKHWHDAAMPLRWTGAAMQEPAKGFRRIKAHCQLPSRKTPWPLIAPGTLSTPLLNTNTPQRSVRPPATSTWRSSIPSETCPMKHCQYIVHRDGSMPTQFQLTQYCRSATVKQDTSIAPSSTRGSVGDRPKSRRSRRRATAALRWMVLVLAVLCVPAAFADQAGIMADVTTCLVKPSHVIQLGSPVFGALAAVFVDRSDPVKQGQVLAKLNTTVEETQLALDRYRATNTTQIEAAKVDLQWNQRELARRQKLAGNMFSKANDIDEYVTKVEQDRLAIRKAEADLETAKLEAARSESQLNLKILKSPVNGVVTEMKLSPGEFIYEQTPIMTIADVDPLHIDLVVPAQRIRSVKVGTIGEVYLSPPVDATLPARVDAVDPVIDAASDTFRIRLVLPNPGNAIPAGVRCTVRLPDAAIGG